MVLPCREAEINNGKLKGVGARIVVETLHRAMEGSEHSIVRDTTFKPSLGPNNNTFRMVDLMLFAFEGKRTCSRRSAQPSVELRRSASASSRSL